MKQKTTAKFILVATATVVNSYSALADNEKGGIRRGFYLPANETHLITTFNAKSSSGKFPTTLRIPRDYVNFRLILTESGAIYYLPIQFRLPGIRPISKELPSDKIERSQHPPGWRNIFYMSIGEGDAETIRSRLMGEINRKNKSFIKDEYLGLDRYSPTYCYTEERLKKDSEARKALSEKPIDDPRPESNCRTWQNNAILISPDSTPPGERIYIECMPADCYMRFNINSKNNIRAEISINSIQIKEWSAIANSSKELVTKFID